MLGKGINLSDSGNEKSDSGWNIQLTVPRPLALNEFKFESLMSLITKFSMPALSSEKLNYHLLNLNSRIFMIFDAANFHAAKNFVFHSSTWKY